VHHPDDIDLYQIWVENMNNVLEINFFIVLNFVDVSNYGKGPRVVENLHHLHNELL
jgi:hypothetical protein